MYDPDQNKLKEFDLSNTNMKRKDPNIDCISVKRVEENLIFFGNCEVSKKSF